MATITSAATSLWSATGTWVGAVVPVLGDKVTIANGHTVTVDGTYSVGDDTTTALTINGVLKASRTVSSDLTVRGGVTSTQLITSGSAAGLDYGTEADPIPVAYTAILRLNDSAALANGKYSLNFPRGQFFRAWGAAKKPWTRLTVGVAVSAGSFSVADATGWASNDWLYLASTTDGTPSAHDYVQITSVTGTGPYTVNVAPTLSFVHAVSAPVANMTRNVVFRPTNIAFGSPILLSLSGDTAANINTYCSQRYEIGYAEFYCLGSTALGGNTGIDPVTILLIDNKAVTITPIKKLYGISGHNPKSGTVTSGTGSVMPYGGGTVNPFTMDWCVGYSRNAAAISFKYGVCITGNNLCGIYGMYSLEFNGSTGPINTIINGSFFGGGTVAGALLNLGIGNRLNNCDISASLNAVAPGFGGPTVLDACRIGTGAGNAKSTNMLGFSNISSPGAVGDFTIQNCTLQAYARTDVHNTDQNCSDNTLVKLYTNAGTDDYYQMRYGFDAYAEVGVINRGTRSLKLMPSKASAACAYTASQPGGVAGKAFRVVGYVRLNSTYGTSPITVTLSGQGSTLATFISSTVADTWQKFDLTVTPTSNGALSLVVSGLSSNTTTAAFYLDGVYNDPFTYTFGHYGFAYSALAYRTVDPVVQITESAASTLTGISYAAGTLTISGSRSIREIYDWMKWYEASNRLAPIITSADGVAFVLAAALTMGAAAAITGTGALTIGANTLTLGASATSTVNVTHSAGVWTTVTVTGLIDGTTLIVDNSTTSANLYTGTPGASWSANIQWPNANHSIRVRARYVVGAVAKTPIDTTGTLTSTGLILAVAQTTDTYYTLDGSAITGITFSGPAVTASITTTQTLAKLYAAAVYWASQTGNFGYATPVSTADGINYLSGYTITVAAAVAITGAGAISLGAAALSVGAGATSTVVWAYSSGAAAWVQVNVTGIVNGSRVQVYNSTTSAELSNSVPGTTLAINAIWTTNHTLRLRVAYQSGVTAMVPVQAIGLLTNTGASFLVAQVSDTIYNTLAIDGSTCTEFTADFPNLQIDVSGFNRATTVQRVYAWAAWAQCTTQGIAAMFRAVIASDAINFQIDVTVVNAQIDNVSATPAIIGGGYLARSDGTTVIASMSGSIQMDPSKAYTAPSLPAALAAAVWAQVLP